MDSEFSLFNLDQVTLGGLKTAEEIKRHSIDSTLEENPIQRAIYILGIGEEVQRIAVLQSLSDLITFDQTACLQKVLPKMLQVIPNASTEYHVQASEKILTLVQKKLITMDIFTQTFLQTVISAMDNRDQVVADAWLETLLNIIQLLPINIIQTEIWPIAVSKAQMIKPVPVRLSSCKLLGAIANHSDAQIMRKDLLPIVISLCQDVNADVRACMCFQLPSIATQLNDDLKKSYLLPCIIELASDEVSKVKEASVIVITRMLHSFNIDILKSIVSLLKQMIIYAFKFDESLVLAVANNYGTICEQLKRVLQPAEKEQFLKWFLILSNQGVQSAKRNDNEKTAERLSMFRHESYNEKCILYRQYCAVNFSLVAKFCKGDSGSKLLEMLYPAFDCLSTDPYFIIRKSAAAGFYDVLLVYDNLGGTLIPELLTFLHDDAEEVLEGIVPNLSLIITQLIKIGAYKVETMDSNLFEISRALLKCEHVLAGSHNWRTHFDFFKQLEIVPFLFPSEFGFNCFAPLLFKRLHSTRAVPVRVAVAQTLCILLRYFKNPQHRFEIRSFIINDLCQSSNFYNRMLYLRICPFLMEIFSTSYFKEYFYLKTIQLVDDPVPNIRTVLCRLLPPLKAMIKSGDKKLYDAFDFAVTKLSVDTDKETLKQLQISKAELQNCNFAKMFPGDQKKFEEESSLLMNVAPNKHPKEKLSTHIPQTRSGVKQTARPRDSSTLPSATTSTSSIRNAPSSHSSLTVHYPINEEEFLVDAGVNLSSVKKDSNKASNFQKSHYSNRTLNGNNTIIVLRKETGGKLKKGSPSKGIPVRRSLNNPITRNTSLMEWKSDIKTKSQEKRHSLEVTDLNQNHEKDLNNLTLSDKNESQDLKKVQVPRKPSHLPRPLSCVNFPVKLDGMKKPISRLPVSRLSEQQRHQKLG